MAFSLGSITYTIFRLIPNFINPEPEPVFPSSDTNNGGLSLDGAALFDEDRVAKAFDQPTNSPTDDLIPIEKQIEKTRAELEAVYAPEKQETKEFQEMVEKVAGDIEKTNPVKLVEVETEAKTIEEISITQYYMKYNYDYGDMKNLRMRSDFVLKAAESKKKENESQAEAQKIDADALENKKSETRLTQDRKDDELRLQRNLAEKYTRRFD